MKTMPVGRRREGDGIGAQEGITSPGRHDQRARGGATDADHVVSRRQQRVVARDAVVIAVADHGYAGARLSCFGDAEVHGVPGRRMAHAVLGIQHQRRRRLAHGDQSGPRLDLPALHRAHVVPFHARHSM